MQAAATADGAVLQAVFHQAGSLAWGSRLLTVDAPCVLLLEREGDRWIATASDPEQLPAKTALRVGLAASAGAPPLAFSLSFPAAPRLGAPVTVSVADRP